MRIYFVRHGETNYNVKDLCNDNPLKDVHLTELGKRQAIILAEKLRTTDLDIIFISELPRTRETAEIINEYHKVEIKVDKRINDRKTGFESKSTKDFFRWMEESEDKWNAKINDGESFEEEKNRVFSFLEYLKTLDLKSILVVTHSEIFKIINGYFNNLSNEEMFSINVGNCEVFEASL